MTELTYYHSPCCHCKRKIAINSDTTMIDTAEGLLCSKCWGNFTNKFKGQPQHTDPHAPHYFAPYDDMGNKRTINNAVDAGWSAEGKSREELGIEVGVNISQWDEIHK